MDTSLLAPIEVACGAVGGQSAMASLLGVSAPTVNQWVRGGRPIPIDRCPAIERLTEGAVTRRDLRPDDWWRIWPELVTADHPAPEAKEQDRAAA